MMVNSKTKLDVYPGAFHGFMDFQGMPFAQDGWDSITEFLGNNVTGL
jgi:dienelactone hydrolase